MPEAMSDPYETPFDWTPTLTTEPIDGCDLRGLLPCGCESGFWPLPDGSAIACDEVWRAA